ncbi:MAG: hypothetical protein K0R38_6723 [Polyangiaceae bacterium]|nr:hypothetical protein [Polyangiaceae bacterium]
MRTPRRHYAAFALLVSASWLATSGCSADDSPSNGNPPGAGGTTAGGSAGNGGGPTVVDPGGTSSGGGSQILNRLCGTDVPLVMCTPDDPWACRGYKPPNEGNEGGAAAGGAGGDANGGEAPLGAGGATAGAPAGGADGGAGEAGGAPSIGGETASGGAAASSGQGGEGQEPSPLPAYGCQVSRQNNEPYRSCVPAGSGRANAPCFTAADCAPGLACVTEGEAARCLPYCCEAAKGCEAGTYCAERPLRRAPSDPSEAELPSVPVCVPADGCSLEDPYPCPSDSLCRCQSGTACMVVRDDGTTSCLEPGENKKGEMCPCAWNHVCSKVTNRCVQICRTDAATNECGEQRCQASSELPDHFGVCVGQSE